MLRRTGADVSDMAMRQATASTRVAVGLFLSFWPAMAMGADLSPVGVVTTLEGQAVVSRAALSQQPLPLKFKDRVFFKDRLSTKERSIARVLLMEKAIITVRELSTLTITEAAEPRRASVLDMASGKVSLAVARLRMTQGESVEVRTPHAVIGVRGTFLVVEVIPVSTAQPTSEPEAAVTNIYLLEGAVEVFTHGAPTTPIPLGALQSISISGAEAGLIRSIPSSAVPRILQGLTPKFQHAETPDEAKEAVIAQEEAKVQAVSEVLVPGLASQGAAVQGLSGSITPLVSTVPSAVTSSVTSAMTMLSPVTTLSSLTTVVPPVTPNIQNIVIPATTTKLP